MKRKKKPPASADPRVAGLIALQDELGLTDKQRRFVEALAIDPGRNQTKAALTAGVSKKSAHVMASKWLKLVKVQKYFYALTAASRELRAEETAGAVADLHEVLVTLTGHMRAKVGHFMVPMPGGGYQANVEAIVAAPPGVVRGLEHDEAGDIKLKLVDGHAAAKTLLAHYTDKPSNAGGVNVTLNTVIASLPGEMVAALFQAMALASGRQPAGLLPQSGPVRVGQ